MNYGSELIVVDKNFSLLNLLPEIGIDKARAEILSGLKSEQKFISSKFFYDKRGSELFEEITKLDEYYPTRTEKSILSTIVSKLDLDFEDLSIIELGSGDASKISLLLKQIPENILNTIKYYPIDISQSAIEQSSKALVEKFPMISINGIVADFIHQKNLIPQNERKLFCFFGSTIGNMKFSEIKNFLKLLSSEMSRGDSLLLGLDMVKDVEILEKAYNDSKQVTAAFNKNILMVVNNLIRADFNPYEFEHLAFYNKYMNRIEMHLKAFEDMTIRLNHEADEIFIRRGETIHTENSHKFSLENVEQFSSWAELEVKKIFMDDNEWFGVVHYQK